MLRAQPSPGSKAAAARGRGSNGLALVEKVRATGARTLIPCAGVHAFLDPTPEGNRVVRFNEVTNDASETSTIFPRWECFAERTGFAKACPGCRVLDLLPGDRVRAGSLVPYPGADRPVESTWRKLTPERLKRYSEMRRPEWEKFWSFPPRVHPVTGEDVQRWAEKLNRRNKSVIRQTGWSKRVRLGVMDEHGMPGGGRSWVVVLGSTITSRSKNSDVPTTSGGAPAVAATWRQV